jgi:DNA-binding CsgD family transcriptional regulator
LIGAPKPPPSSGGEQTEARGEHSGESRVNWRSNKPTGRGMAMIDESDRLIGLIYEGITDDFHWDAALERVAAFVGAIGVGLGMQDMESHQFRGLASHGIDLDLSDRYRRLAPTNKIWIEIGRRRQPLTDRMVMPKADFLRSELYADWFRPQGFQGMMAAPALFKNKASVVLVTFRDRRREDFERADLKKIRGLAYHFGQALNMRVDRERAEQEFAAAKMVLDQIPDAILFVDRMVRLKHVNKVGQITLDKGTVIRRLHNGRLEIRDRRADQLLAALISEARGGELRLSGGELGRFVIRVQLCMRGAAGNDTGIMIIRIIDLARNGKAPTAARVRECLGLSLRQSEIISELAKGGTEATVAQKLGIKESTVHEHIRRVYDKLELGSRAELIALLARVNFDITSLS